MADDQLEQKRSDLIRWAFNELDVDSMDVVDKFYGPDVRFIDPVVDVTGLTDLRAHYEHQYKFAKEIGFTFSGEHISGDTHTVEWNMTLRTKRLNKGKAFTVPGVSVITFKNEKAVYHRDYFDLGSMVYERLPVVRRITKKIKKRLHYK
jgi:limonene-1,2-epoxide hydrolase